MIVNWILVLILMQSACHVDAECHQVEEVKFVELNSDEQIDLLRECDADGSARLFLYYARENANWASSRVFGALIATDLALGPAMARLAERTPDGDDDDLLLILNIISVIPDPRLPSKRDDREALFLLVRRRVQSVADPQKREIALFFVSNSIGPTEGTVPGEEERDQFVSRFIRSLVDGTSFYRSYISADEEGNVEALRGRARGAGQIISRKPYEEEGDGTTHEYIVRFANGAYEAVWVHQVEGRIVRAGIRPGVAVP